MATLATGAKVVQNSFVGLVKNLSYSSRQIKSRAVVRHESLQRQVKMSRLIRQDFFESSRLLLYDSLLLLVLTVKTILENVRWSDFFSKFGEDGEICFCTMSLRAF